MHAYLLVVNQHIWVWSSTCHKVERHTSAYTHFWKTTMIFLSWNNWRPKAMAEFSHQYKVPLANIFMTKHRNRETTKHKNKTNLSWLRTITRLSRVVSDSENERARIIVRVRARTRAQSKNESHKARMQWWHGGHITQRGVKSQWESKNAMVTRCARCATRS